MALAMMATNQSNKIAPESKVRCTTFFVLATFYISVCLFASVCSAQQTEPAAVENEQLLVNWAYGAYVPKDVPLVPMNPESRLILFERQSFTTPGIYIRSNFLGLLDQAKGSPEEWGGGIKGYGRRVTSAYSQTLIQNTLAATGNALLQYEPRYDRCRCSGFWPRTRHALMRNFLTYNKTERELRPQFALYGAAFTAGAISSAWKPRTEFWEQGAHGVLTQAAFGLISNWVGEFSPEIKRVLHRKSHSTPEN
jgi:hypothetical protein